MVIVHVTSAFAWLSTWFYRIFGTLSFHCVYHSILCKCFHMCYDSLWNWWCMVGATYNRNYKFCFLCGVNLCADGVNAAAIQVSFFLLFACLAEEPKYLVV